MKSATFFRWLFVLSLFPTFLFSQQAMQVKLKLFSFDTWGVYVRPINGISPGTQTITGTAQVTVVMPKNYPWTGLQSVSGTWAANAYVDGPMENPTKSYVSFGLIADFPHINYVAGQETLLFKFKRTTACPDSIYIINNATDPFCQLPNSVNSNPGNEFSVWDPNGGFYEYHSNYAPSAWSCHDNDGDAVLNAFEDTNGNGIFDAGDASDLNEHNGGMNLKLQLIEENKWGVYVKPDSTITPGPLTITGTAQVTVVAPKNYFQYNSNWGFVSLNGTWAANAHVNGPVENPTKQYISIGLQNDFPHISYVAGQETLLFTFKGNGACPDSIYLIDNATDPFAQLPNSVNSNPGNEFSVWDPNGPHLYTYHQNYAPSAWSCHDNDDDGILNAFEDTNGNGVFDAGVDASDLNANCIPTLTASIGQGITVCHGEEAYFIASFAQPNMELSFMQWQIADNETGPWADIMNPNGIYTGVTQTSSGTSGTDTLTITNTAGLNGKWYRAICTNTSCDVPVYSDAAQLVVEGPLNIALHPVGFTNCATESATFTALVSNQGAGTMSYLWQYSTDGVTWADLSNSSSPGGANYATVTSTTLNMANINVAMDGWYFRMRTSSNECSVYSNPARLNVEGSITVTDQPDGVYSCSGGEAYFVASFSNAGNSYPANQSQTLTNYIWQISYNSGATWSNLTNATGVYAGISGSNVGETGSDTLNITNVMSLNGYQYRVAYTTPTCSMPVYSSAASLEVSENSTFSNDPDDVTVCSGNDTVFVASASMPLGTFSFGWQYSDDNGVTWVDIDFETMSALFAHSITGEVASGTDGLTVKNVAGMYGRRFRSVAYPTDCNAVYSNYAILSVEGPLTVNTHPTSVTECSGNSTIFQASFNNPGVVGSTIYRWQVSANGGATWFNLLNSSVYNGTATTQLSVSNVAGLNDICYRLSARTSTCNITFTNAACITVEGPITVTDHPDNVTQCAGGSVTFTAAAAITLGNPGNLKYQWQWSSDGINYSNVAAAGINGFSGWNTPTLVVGNVAGLYSRRFRLAVSTGECNNIHSLPAILTVEGPISITDQPDDIFQCSGNGVTLIVGTTNDSPQDNTVFYGWQESTDGGTTWANLVNDTLYNGVETNQLSIGFAGLDGNQYRCVVWTGTCSTVTSAAATLNNEGPLIVVDEPDNITECPGSGVTFQAAIYNAGPGVLQYQWEASSDNSVTWNNLSNDGDYSGVTTTTLSIADVAGKYGYRYRMRYWTATCNSKWTNYALLSFPSNCNPGCLKLKLKLLPDSSGWAVMAKPFGGYVPSANAMTTAGRVTLVAPADFVLDGFSTEAGDWTPANATNLPNNPARKYITFELQMPSQGQQEQAIPFALGQETMLFKFEKTGPCPDSLYLLETVPAGLQPNKLEGYDPDGLTPGGFEYCGVYARKAWRCKRPTTIPNGPIIIVTTDSLGAPQPGATDRDTDFSAGKKAKGQWFTASPNPAGDFVNIVVSENLAEGRPTLTLWDMQGKKRLEMVVGNAATQLDLGDLPAGVYLISLAQNGRVVERKKLVKN